jgi:hypothetical protein
MKMITGLSTALLLLAAPSFAATPIHHRVHKIRHEVVAPSVDPYRYQAYQPLSQPASGRCYGSHYNYSWGPCGSQSGGPSGAPDQGG